MLNAGRLRHRITIEYPVIAQDSNGGTVVDEWALFGKFWAAIEPLSARELIAAQATQSKVVAKIILRYTPGMYAAMRVLHGSKTYNIEGILTDRDSGLEYITLPVSEGIRTYEAG